MRMSITIVLALAAAGCAGDETSSTRACAGNLYDACLSEHDCSSLNCHNFITQGFQVCSTGCTPGDDAPCMTTADGKKATCVMGICTPPAANRCTPPHQ